MDQKKLTDAMHRIEELWNETEGKCYVSFSGGKDSTVLLALIKMCQDLYTIGDIPAVFSNTGIELQVTVDFVKWCKDSGYYQNVQMITPEKSFGWVMENKGKPSLSKMRSEGVERWHRNPTPSNYQNVILGITNSGKTATKSRLADKHMHYAHPDFAVRVSQDCCKYLKKNPFKKYHRDSGMKGCITGIRIEEGGSRDMTTLSRLRSGGKLCTVTKHGITYKYPIIDWAEQDVDDFVEEFNVPLSDAYTKYGFKRTGCMACPYSPEIKDSLLYLHNHEPQKYKAAMHWLKDVYIAQNVELPFDTEYEAERIKTWDEKYRPMRIEMLEKYRPNSRLLKKEKETYGAEQLPRT